MAKGVKTGGRKKGTPNKKTAAKRQELEKLFMENGGFQGLFDDIASIEDPAQKATAKLKVVKFFMAEMKEIEIGGELDLFTHLEIIEEDGTESDTENKDE